MIFNSRSLEDTYNIAKMFKSNIYSFSNVLLFGEMGSGKTHFVKFLLLELGVNTNVRSPSYTMCNYYEFNKLSVWHYDLYRLDFGQKIHDINEHFASDDMVIVEWAEKLDLKPNNRVEVYLNTISEFERSIEFKFFGTSFSPNEVRELFFKYKTPSHVVEHCSLTAEVGMKIAQKLINSNVLVDLGLVYSGAMLHDLLRYVDFPGGIDRSKLDNISDADYKFMLDTRKKYDGIHHSEAASILLKGMSYPEIAFIVKGHCSYQLFRGFTTIEEKIVNYSDKRVLHDNFVTIKQRLEDGKIRYAKEGTPEYWVNLEEKLFSLEKELMVDF